MLLKKLLLSAILSCIGLTDVNAATEIWVSPNGSDKNAGTKEHPVQTVAQAVRLAREMRRLNDPKIDGGIQIFVKEGTYQLFEPIYIRTEDAGTISSPTTITNAPGEQPIISGGTQVKGWQKLRGTIKGLPKEAVGNVWVADAPKVHGRVIETRQLWVNDVKATRARDRDGDSMSRIIRWDKATEQVWIPKPKTASLKDVETLEFLIHQWWEVANLRVRQYEDFGDSVRLSFYQPESKIQNEHPWPAPWHSAKTGNSAFFLSNAIQLLNQPGEWFQDITAGKIYYWPRTGENLSTANVVIPVLENLVQVNGSIDFPVQYFNLNGLHFKYATWLRPSHHGHVPHQAGLYMLEAYKLKIPGTPDKKGLENQAWLGRQGAGLLYNFAHNNKITNCTFMHMAATGVDFVRGSKNNFINGNVFKDLGGTALMVGTFSDEDYEAHIPFNPFDSRVVANGDIITNNLISNATNEDWGCVGIGAGFVKNITIANNDISDLGYSGISLGWGWSRTTNVMSNNKVLANKITHYGKHMYDVAAVYTLSSQPGSQIMYNHIDSIYVAPYAHLPEHWFYLYCDEGSTYFTVKDNWCPQQKFLRNANGPNNLWENNGPMVSDSIRMSAGLKDEFKHLLKHRTDIDYKRPVNYFDGIEKNTGHD